MLQEICLHISRIARIAAWLFAAAIVLLSVVPASLRPETSVPHAFEHVLIFAATGAAFGMAYDVRLAVLVARLVGFAGAVEVIQLFVPGRHGRLSDFLTDAAAISAAAVLASLAKPTLCKAD
jgi:hypothetical protein